MKAAQNPLANVMSFPFQYNANFNANVVKPDFGPDWQLRLQAQVMLPESMFGGK